MKTLVNSNNLKNKTNNGEDRNCLLPQGKKNIVKEKIQEFEGKKSNELFKINQNRVKRSEIKVKSPKSPKLK